MAAASEIAQRFARGEQLAAPGENQALLTAIASGRPLGVEHLERLAQLHPATLADLDRPRRCVVCRLPYREVDNVGQLQCARHFGAWNEGREEWPCCGARYRVAPGCMRSDHIDDADAQANLGTRVPEFLCRLMSPPRPEAIPDARRPPPATIEWLGKDKKEAPLAGPEYDKYLLRTSELVRRTTFAEALQRMVTRLQSSAEE